MRRAGDVVSRGDIAEHVWDEHYDPMSNVVDVYVQRLRRKLDRSGSESLIRTRRGEGYQLVGGPPRMKTLSLRARLTLWYTLALLVVLLLFGANVLWQQRRIGHPARRSRARGADATLGESCFGRSSASTTIPALAREATAHGDGDRAAAPSRFSTPAAASLAAQLDRRSTLARPCCPAAGRSSVRTVETGRGAWRVHVEPAQHSALPRSLLVVAAPLTDIAREQHEVQEAMLVGIPIVLLLAGAGGLWLASIGLRPITAMARRAASIPLTGLEDLGRLQRDDELGQLATAFNGLVARLRAALQTQRQFMADASHELRTPVSVVRADLRRHAEPRAPRRS